MDFFRKKKEQKSGEGLPSSTLDVKSTETTPYQSGVPSEFEKEMPTEPSLHSARSQSDSQHPEEAKPAIGENAIESAEKKVEGIEKEADEELDDTEYPTALKLTLITIALCLSVLCMGMFKNPVYCTNAPLAQVLCCGMSRANRLQHWTTRLSLRPSRRSQTSSKRLTMWDGMALRTS